ncbi:MAG: hypothetical protein ISS56_10110 [Anaerolineae bacterium]|nr:hypothetical protein [Anaerolineae bacterium]
MKQAKTAGSIALLAGGLVFLCAGGLLGVLGALYILAAHSEDAARPGTDLGKGIGMLVAGLVVWTVAAVIGFLAWRRMQPKPEQKVTIHQEVELTGDIDLASLKCEKCAANLDKDAVAVKEGALLISCPYCGAAYQVVEEPKW